MDHQRNFQRVDFQSKVEVHIAAANISCTLINLALRGTLLQSHEQLPLKLGEEAKIFILLQDSTLNLGFQARLVHQEGDHYGFVFTEADSDSMAHLRRLMELNTGNGDLVDSEFDLWLQQHESGD